MLYSELKGGNMQSDEEYLAVRAIQKQKHVIDVLKEVNALLEKEYGGDGSGTAANSSVLADAYWVLGYLRASFIIRGMTS